MHLPLKPRFSFAEFKKVTPIDSANLIQLIISRHAGTISVRRPANTEENLRRIFDSTFKLANKTGFSAMSLRDLSRDSGISMGGLYGYFNGKDDIAAMIQDILLYLASNIPSWFANQRTPLERLDATLRGHIFLSELMQPWFYFVFMESRTLSSTHKTVAKSTEIHMQSQIAQLFVEALAIPEEQAELLGAHCMALIHDWHVKRWKYRQLKISVDVFANSVCDFVLKACAVVAAERHPLSV